MRICVTGGAGYIGSALVERLRVKGHDVDVIDWVVGKDLFHVRRFDYDIVYHLAALAGVGMCEKHPNDFVGRMNIDACEHVARSCDSDTLLIYTSTSAIHATPLSTYAVSKHMGEALIRDLHERSIILRLATVYGISPSLRDGLLVHDFVRSAIKDGFIVIRNPDDVRPFVTLHDYVRMLSIFTKGQPTDNLLNTEYWDVFDHKLWGSKRLIAGFISKLTHCEIYYSLNKDKYPQDIGKIKARSLWTNAMKPISEETIKPIVDYYEREYPATFYRA